MLEVDLSPQDFPYFLCKNTRSLLLYLYGLFSNAFNIKPLLFPGYKSNNTASLTISGLKPGDCADFYCSSQDRNIDDYVVWKPMGKRCWAESSIHDVGSELRNIIICLRKAAALRQTARSGSKHLQAEVLEMWNLGVEPSEALGVEALATDLLWPSSWDSPTQPGPGLCLVPPPFIPTHGELLQVPLEATRSSMGNTQHQLVTAGGGLLGRTEAPWGMVASPAASPLLRAKDGGWPEADISSVCIE
ncbi:hypothetical protein AAY473_004772 [Plecturocebus cupreus]